VELALGLVALLTAGLLTSAPPAREALTAEQKQGFAETARAGDLRIQLRVAPARAGENEIGVDLQDLPEFDEDGVDPQVLLRLEKPGSEIGPAQVETSPAGGGETGGSSSIRYAVRGSYLTLSGPWQVEVIVRRGGMNDVRHTFTVGIQPSNLGALQANPIPASAESIARGQALYPQYCAECHGVSGRGDGPVGLGLNPPPADLTEHAVVGAHPDGQLFEWISQGIPNSAMPAFEEEIPEEERWNLVNFIRQLARIP
jgi:mono/diheme cytochrome c family protein